ncbi:hypothetical protein C8Q80DRAFT_1104999 [Daedaleopsis nitida]|nr:hypothetical protein C8Q80DRAFT_1104999 [Daedaleopsis nitida]
MADAIQRAIFLELYPTITKIRYAELASTMIILFDHLLTLDQEVRLIWSAQWSLGKILFLINRYYALCVVVYLYVNRHSIVMGPTLTECSCLHWFRWQGWTGIITFVIAELILQLRLYALYFRSKRVLAVTNIVCLAAAIGSSYVMGHALSLIVAFAIQLPNTGSTVCVPIGLPDGFYQFWIPMLISECVLCGLALYRGFRSYRPTENLLQSGRRIIETLVRDSVWYFVVIFATYLTNAIIFLTRGGAEVEIPIGFAVALSTVMSSRLCLNVRGYIRDESVSDALPGPASAVYSPRAGNTQNAFVSFPGEDRDDATRSNPVSKVVQSGDALGEIEMRELRSMRASSPGPRSILRMPFSIGRRSPCLDEVIHIT